MVFLKKKMFLLDGHSLANRAFYALPLLQNSNGDYTNAVFGFARMLFRLMDDENPDILIVAFDRKAPTFRHKAYDDYKANRKKMPDELSPQIPLIKKMLKKMGIPIVGIDGYEADDVLGTIACLGEGEGYDVNIVTGDRDAFQLVTDNIKVIYTKRGITDIEKYDPEKIKERYEMEPIQLVDMKGLMGDSSDNIPGVPGIGEKTAISLIKEFKSLEGVLDNISRVSGKKRKENLREYTEQARMSKKLAKIKIDVPLEINFTECLKAEEDTEGIINFIREMEFTSLLDRFETGKEIDTEKINIIRIEQVDNLSELADKIKKKGKMALSVILKDLEHPVSSEIKEMIVALDGKDIYRISLINELPDKFKDIIEDESIKKYLLQGKESLIALNRLGIELRGLEFDPLLAAYLLKPSDKLPSLEEQLKNELNFTLPEDIDEENKIPVLVASMYEMEAKLNTKLESMNLLELYEIIEIPLIKTLAEMELNGITVDVEYLKELSSIWKSELDNITKSIYQLADEEFNLNSPKQLGVILFEKIGLPVIKKTKTGYSTSADVLETLKEKHEIINLIMEYRQLMKLKSTYVDSLPPLLNKDTNRVHTSFNQMVTATGRLSSTEPNLQNIPIRTEEGREIRKTFIPESKEWALLAADYSQVELRVLAHISGDEGLISAFNNNEDIHTQTASEVFEVDTGEVTADMRRHAKVINFGIAYGMSPYGLARDLDISRKEAEEYINRYFGRFKGVKEYMDNIIIEAKELGYVKTIFNRIRYIPEINSRNFHRRSFAERAAINTPIQGSAADIMKIAMNRVFERLMGEKDIAHILLQVHDELVLEVKKEYLPEIAVIVKKEMEEATELKVPLIVDLQTGENWRDKQDYIIGTT